jgi:hypothetical protein
VSLQVASIDAAASTGWSVLLEQAEHVLRQLQDATIDDPWAEASRREAALDYSKARGRRVSVVLYAPEEVARLRRLMSDDVSIERAQRELSTCASGAAASTVEALMFALREGGVDEPHVVRRLAQLDHAQVRDIATRLQKLEPHIAPAWTPEDVEALLTVWSETHAE